MIRSDDGIKQSPLPYENFQGLDDSRDIAAMDNGKAQALIKCDNAFCDWRGTITRDAGAAPISVQNQEVNHITFYALDRPIWSYEDDQGQQITTAQGHSSIGPAFPKGSKLTSTVFNSRVLFFAENEITTRFTGVVYEKVEPTFSKLKPAFGVTISNRVAAAGDPRRKGFIDISRFQDESVYAEDEDPSSLLATRAGSIDLRSIIGTADEVQGLGVFERNRLIIFTNDQAVTYIVDPNIDLLQIDDKGALNFGCISHNTIANAGADILFCSRHGVYSLRRSDANGITLFTIPLSSKVDFLYRALVKTVADPRDISAYYDQDNGQYHIFFPRGIISTRLTMSLSPVPESEPKWSTSTYLNQTCGAALGGYVALGTIGGVWRRGAIEDSFDISPEAVIETPILWAGSLEATKESTKVILQATGEGTIMVEAFDQDNKPLQSWEVSTGDSASSSDPIPLSKQYERKFEHRFRGVRFRFTLKGKGLMKLIGFALSTRK